MELKQKILSRRARVGVIGLGYVGLPLAVEFCKSGFSAVGFDVDKKKVDAIKKGRSYIADVSSEDLSEQVEAKRMTATADFAKLTSVDAIIICVPTPLRKTRDPDISYIVAAVDQIAPRMKKGQLVVLESTTYPGTTEEVILPRLQAGGLKVGRDFYLAFSPERVDPGNPKFRTKNTPKVVGGVTPACTRLAVLLYGASVDRVVPVSSTRSAEMIKLLENTFRAVNIALVNEIALMCEKLGISVWEVIDAAATKPFGFMPFYPGPGIGGHCIPLDPHYLSWKLKTLNFYSKFIELAAEINGSMPEHVVKKITDLLNDDGKSVRGSRVLVLGVAYKRDTNDVRESPALDVIKLLEERGAKILFHDPAIETLHIENGVPRRRSPLTAKTLASSDCVVIVTDHSSYDYDWLLRHARRVLDTRNATHAVTVGRERIVRL
jgi:UDP-N-acetyl-D-glucosamine dehydrogenase